MKIKCDTCGHAWKEKFFPDPLICPDCESRSNFRVLSEVVMHNHACGGPVGADIPTQIEVHIEAADLQKFLDEWKDGAWMKKK